MRVALRASLLIKRDHWESLPCLHCLHGNSLHNGGLDSRECETFSQSIVNLFTI